MKFIIHKLISIELRLMLSRLCLSLLLLLPLSAVCQISTLDSIIDEIDFEGDSIKSVFDWVINNISYEVELLEQAPSARSRPEIIAYVLASKQGVCAHYAELFNALISKIGYEAYVVIGYTKNLDMIGAGKHAWNAIKTRNGWFLYDPTWSSGHLENGKFVRKTDHLWYEVKPEEFIYTHVPFDPIWQFLSYPVVAKPENIHMPSKRYFNYEDSIRLHTGTQSLRSIENEFLRVKQYSDSNVQVNEYLNFLKKLKRYHKVNNAISLYNEASSYFNMYVDSRNRAFRNPRRSIENAKELLYLTEDILIEIRLTLDIEDFANYPFEQGEKELITSCQELKQAVDCEIDFMNRYERTWPPLRIFKFWSFKK